MRPPGARLTVRGLMVAVAFVAMPLGLLAERRGRLDRVAAGHRAEVRRIIGSGFDPFADADGELVRIMFPRAPGSPADPVADRLDWHAEMYSRYRAAARQPWMPLGPDPPEPMP